MHLTSSHLRYLALVSGWCLFASAQQYAGDNITNSLPSVPGAELAYFRIADPAGKNNHLTLINYNSLQADSSRLDPLKVQRAVIIIHGLNEDPGTYMSEGLSALSQQTSDPNVNFSSVAIVTPFFVNGDSKGTSYPWNNATSSSTSNCLVWKGSKWSAGANNQYPSKNTNVSSFEVLDQLIKYFDDTSRFPLMKHIVIAGHSLGAQTVHRYAEIGNQFATNSSLSYWIGNPDSFAWLSLDRPIASMVRSCTTYDVWRDGFTNFTQYPMTYGLSLVNSGRSAILANFQTRSKAYARGTQDLGDDASSCGPYTTGLNRNERFFNWIKAFPPACASASGQCDTVDYVNAGHDAGIMFASTAGITRLFLDNFYGNASIAYDFGYPRLQAGDDPHPNPSLVNTTLPTNTTGGSASNMTYQGCWTDDVTDIDALPLLAFDRSNTTIESCTAACAAKGYIIAGLEYGSQCYCGNTISAYSEQTQDAGCTMACPGNSSEVCGNSYRLSVYSKGTLKQYAQPVQPTNVSNYAFSNCMTEATSGRALDNLTYTDAANMTLVHCATFCEGYKYFGVEYSTQCYCGDSFGIGANVTASTDCVMTCSGNTTEQCGAANRLSVYSKQYNLPVKASTTSSSTKKSTATSSTSKSSVHVTSSSTMKTTSKALTTSMKSTVKPMSTSAALVWNSKCTAACHANSCAGFSSKVLSYCKAHATNHVVTAVQKKIVTATKVVINTGKTATVTASPHVKAAASAKKANVTTVKATCATAPSILAGYNCGQVSSLCGCLATTTKTVTMAQTAKTVTVTQWPKATKTVTKA